MIIAPFDRVGVFTATDHFDADQGVLAAVAVVADLLLAEVHVNGHASGATAVIHLVPTAHAVHRIVAGTGLKTLIFQIAIGAPSAATGQLVVQAGAAHAKHAAEAVKAHVQIVAGGGVAGLCQTGAEVDIHAHPRCLVVNACTTIANDLVIASHGCK